MIFFNMFFTTKLRIWREIVHNRSRKICNNLWFVGFAPAENPQIAVAVLLEYDGGSGGANAAPIARDVMKKYLGK